VIITFIPTSRVKHFVMDQIWRRRSGRTRIVLHCSDDSEQPVKTGLRRVTANLRQVYFTPIVLQKSKLQVYEFFAKTRNGKQSPIRITSFALPKSPGSLT
jgi:hypothetical protein